MKEFDDGYHEAVCDMFVTHQAHLRHIFSKLEKYIQKYLHSACNNRVSACGIHTALSKEVAPTTPDHRMQNKA